ncbi:hypothetical protein [Sinomonas flava]|uniref:hypothetical protein n=1 Tax=Sinomonas flava TaxID=496857 RepID=UPI0039A50483
MLSQAPESLEVLLTDSGHLNELLDNAEATLRQVAMQQRCAGILVTRHNPARYTLTLTESVPYGETHERTL